MQAEPLFSHRDGVYIPSELTRGPWTDDAQHAGPLAALIAGMMEDMPAERPMQIVRITFELLRPIPLRPIMVKLSEKPDGKGVQRLTASAFNAETRELLVTATGLRIREKDIEFSPETEPAPKSWDESEPIALPRFGPARFVTDAIETRLVSGKPFTEPGPATVWFHLKHPILPDRITSPLQHLCAASDSGNGISGVASFFEMLYVNPDLTVFLTRPPVGEHICLDAKSRISTDGIGGSEAAIFDDNGRVGFAYQTLLVSPR